MEWDKEWAFNHKHMFHDRQMYLSYSDCQIHINAELERIQVLENVCFNKFSVPEKTLL